MAKTENQNQYYPIEMSMEEYRNIIGASQYPYTKIRIGSRTSNGILIPIEDEKVYRQLIHNDWIDEKTLEWKRRCMIRSEKTGKLIRCTACCANCERLRDGQPLSLDMLHDETEYEVKDEHQDMQRIDAEILFHQLLALLKTQAPEIGEIFQEMYDGVSQREIARRLGLPHSTVTCQVERMRNILRQYVSPEDLEN